MIHGCISFSFFLFFFHFSIRSSSLSALSGNLIYCLVKPSSRTRNEARTQCIGIGTLGHFAHHDVVSVPNHSPQVPAQNFPGSQVPRFMSSLKDLYPCCKPEPRPLPSPSHIPQFFAIITLSHNPSSPSSKSTAQHIPFYTRTHTAPFPRSRRKAKGVFCDKWGEGKGKERYALTYITPTR